MLILICPVYGQIFVVDYVQTPTVCRGCSKSYMKKDQERKLSIPCPFWLKMKLDISCESSARQTIRLNYQALFFSLKKTKMIKYCLLILNGT